MATALDNLTAVLISVIERAPADAREELAHALIVAEATEIRSAEAASMLIDALYLGANSEHEDDDF